MSFDATSSTNPATALTLDDAAVETAGRRAAHVENTRRALFDAARELFTEHGYQATRTEEVVQRAGVTRGALYHHFRDKEDLFRAVHEEVESDVTLSLLRRSEAHSKSAWDLFRANNEVYLDAASTNPSYRQVVLVDGPAVFGFQEWIERRGGPTATISAYLRQAMAEGAIDELPVEPLAHLLTSLGVGSATFIAQAEDPEAAHAQIAELTERLLNGLSKSSRVVSREPKTTNKENH